MAFQNCPDQNELSQFNSGILDAAHAERVADHLEKCDDCCETLNGMDTLRPLLRIQQRGTELRFIHEHAYQQVEKRLQEIGQQAESPFPDTDEEALPANTRIGPYRIESCIGKGGMGVVYRARHERLKKEVALKILPAERSGNLQFRSRFEREMEAIGFINHPNIVTGFDAGEFDGNLYLAMELISGLNLSQVLSIHERLSIPNATEIIRQTALALDYVHSRGMLHRDLKPSNLMLARNELGEVTVKILDLGLAQLGAAHSELSDVTDSGQILGTLEFMAPEQADDARTVDKRSDLYALGATLYKLLTGDGPYPTSRFSTPIKMLSAIANSKPAPVADKVDLPEELSILIDGMLSHDPEVRPESAREVAERLQSFAFHADLNDLHESTRNRQSEMTVSFENSETLPYANRTKSSIEISNSKSLTLRWWLFPLMAIAVVMAGIIWLKTDGGYLRIEAPPDIDVTVNILKDNKFVESLEIGQSKDAIWYRAGNYEVRLPTSQQKYLQLKNNVFSLKYRNKRTVTITKVETAKIEQMKKSGQSIPIVSTPSTTSPITKNNGSVVPDQNTRQVSVPLAENDDLKFMRWFWSHCKGSVMVHLPEQDSPQPFLSTKPFPDFSLKVSLATAAKLKPRYAKVIGCTIGRNRQISNELVNDMPIENLQHLEYIKFDFQRKITLQAYLHLLRKKPDLQGLNDNSLKPEELLPTLKKFKRLESFAFSGRIGDGWAAGLGKIRTLKSLRVMRSAVSTSDIDHFAKLPNLKSLSISEAVFSLTWIDSLVKIQSLERLELPQKHGQTFTRKSLLKFAKLGNLKELHLGEEAPYNAVLELHKLLPNCTITFFDAGVPTQVPPVLATIRMSPSEARLRQQKWAETLDLPVERTVTIPGGAKMVFVLIPPGEFLMGSSDADREKFREQSEARNDGWGLGQIASEGPQHRVRISKPFYIAKYEMTRAQWKSITGVDPTNRSYHKGDPEVMPVVEITWDQTQEMLASLNEKVAAKKQKFALPSEAQWEYACRAGTTTAFHFGRLEDAIDGDRFWYGENVERQEQPVGTSQPNAWGIFDMHGNVHEWVQDRADQYPSIDLTIDPVGPSSKVNRNDLHVLRGGSAWDPATACRSALRGRRPGNYKFHALGLRLIMQID